MNLREKTIGFIGVGVMGSAILGGMLGHGFRPESITACDRDPGKLDKFATLGVTVNANAAEAASRDVVFICLKPQHVTDCLAEIKPHTRAGALFVSIAAGVPSELISAELGGAKVVRVMPNAPISEGCGASALSFVPPIERDEFEAVMELFGLFGLAEEVPERAMNAVTAFNGSSPAYFYVIAEAMAQTAGEFGLDTAVCLRLAAKSMEGAAKALLEGESTPGELVKRVAVPGGTTEAALRALENGGMAESIKAGVRACAGRAEEITRSLLCTAKQTRR